MTNETDIKRNMWGTNIDDVGEGFCKECEREYPFHYSQCPLKRNGR